MSRDDQKELVSIGTADRMRRMEARVKELEAKFRHLQEWANACLATSCGNARLGHYADDVLAILDSE